VFITGSGLIGQHQQRRDENSLGPQFPPPSLHGPSPGKASGGVGAKMSDFDAKHFGPSLAPAPSPENVAARAWIKECPAEIAKDAQKTIL